MPNDVEHLRIFGRLYPDNRIVLRPGFLVRRPAGRSAGGPVALYAEVRDDADAVLVQAPLTTRAYCGDTDAVAIRGSVPLPRNARRVLIVKPAIGGNHDLVLSDIDVPPSSPDVEIVDAPTGLASGVQRISWRADEAAALFRVAYSHDGGTSWVPVCKPTTEPSAELDLDVLPGGERCVVSVLATNGVRSTTVHTEPFQVREKRCHAIIDEPAEGAELPDGHVELRGHGWWLESAEPELRELVWASNIDGELGHGSPLPVQLSAGVHEVSLHAGVGERTGSASVTVEVPA